MPFFRFPFLYNPNYYNSYVNYRRNNLNNGVLPKSSNVNNFSQNDYNENSINQNNYKENSVNQNDYNKNSVNQNNFSSSDYNENRTNKKNNSKSNNDNYFFELFGLKLYFDDVLLICLIFFLYDEGVRDNELFISLILLLLS